MKSMFSGIAPIVIELFSVNRFHDAVPWILARTVTLPQWISQKSEALELTQWIYCFPDRGNSILHFSIMACDWFFLVTCSSMHHYAVRSIGLDVLVACDWPILVTCSCIHHYAEPGCKRERIPDDSTPR